MCVSKWFGSSNILEKSAWEMLSIEDVWFSRFISLNQWNLNQGTLNCFILPIWWHRHHRPGETLYGSYLAFLHRCLKHDALISQARYVSYIWTTPPSSIAKHKHVNDRNSMTNSQWTSPSFRIYGPQPGFCLLLFNGQWAFDSMQCILRMWLCVRQGSQKAFIVPLWVLKHFKDILPHSWHGRGDDLNISSLLRRSATSPETHCYFACFMSVKKQCEWFRVLGSLQHYNRRMPLGRGLCVIGLKSRIFTDKTRDGKCSQKPRLTPLPLPSSSEDCSDRSRQRQLPSCSWHRPAFFYARGQLRCKTWGLVIGVDYYSSTSELWESDIASMIFPGSKLFLMIFSWFAASSARETLMMSGGLISICVIRLRWMIPAKTWISKKYALLARSLQPSSRCHHSPRLLQTSRVSMLVWTKMVESRK